MSPPRLTAYSHGAGCACKLGPDELAHVLDAVNGHAAARHHDLLVGAATGDDAAVIRLGDGDLLILTSDHGCDPPTPSTDHSREHALLLAYVEGRNAGGRKHDGEFADVGATVNAWLGGKAPSRGIPGQPIVTP